MANIFENLPIDLSTEQFADIVKTEYVRIERIVSLGHHSPEIGWYDQTENEWVIILQGSGTILFENGDEKTLLPGEYINIPAHVKHKVVKTAANEMTLWLAIFYQ